jgi:hypothetical protein
MYSIPIEPSLLLFLVFRLFPCFVIPQRTEIPEVLVPALSPILSPASLFEYDRHGTGKDVSSELRDSGKGLFFGIALIAPKQTSWR